jgi:hypothetical protein
MFNGFVRDLVGCMVLASAVWHSECEGDIESFFSIDEHPSRILKRDAENCECN